MFLVKNELKRLQSQRIYSMWIMNANYCLQDFTSLAYPIFIILSKNEISRFQSRPVFIILSTTSKLLYNDC